VEEILRLEQEVAERVRKQANDEMAIVAMENEEELERQREKQRELEASVSLSKRREADLIVIKKSLEQTLEEIMSNFENALAEFTREKNKAAAQIGLLESDVGRLRTAVGTLESEKRSLKEELVEMKAAHDTVAKQERELSDKLRVTETDLANARMILEQLRQRAEAKLKAAQQQFTLLQKDNADKAAAIRTLEAELETTRQSAEMYQQQFAQAQAARAQLEDRISKTEKAFADSEARANELNVSLGSVQMEMQTLRRQAQELLTANGIYKEQLSKANEELRQLREDQTILLNAEEEGRKAQRQLQVAVKENQELKSRIFDAMESERKLRAQLASASAGAGSSAAAAAGGGGDAEAELRKLRAANAELSAALQRKETEKQELVGICDELLRQVEASKKAK
jgi:chromosome segregation ATPase